MEEEEEEASSFDELETGVGLEETGAGLDDVESETGVEESGSVEETFPLLHPIRPSDIMDKVISFVNFFIGLPPR